MWFLSFEVLFNVDFKEPENDWRVRLSLRKLGTLEHDPYANCILPKHLRDYNFDEIASYRNIYVTTTKFWRNCILPKHLRGDYNFDEIAS